MNLDNKTTRNFLCASIILFAISLTQKCYCTTSECSDSFMVFILGWAAVFTTAAGMCWLANPLLFISWLMIKKKPKLAMFCAMGSFLLAGFFLVFDSILANEGGQSQRITGYRMGYWLWLGSHFVMLLLTYITVYRINVEQYKKRQEMMRDRRMYEH